MGLILNNSFNSNVLSFYTGTQSYLVPKKPIWAGFAGLPTGYFGEVAWQLPKKASLIVLRNDKNANIATFSNLNLAGVKNIDYTVVVPSSIIDLDIRAKASINTDIEGSSNMSLSAILLSEISSFINANSGLSLNIAGAIDAAIQVTASSEFSNLQLSIIQDMIVNALSTSLFSAAMIGSVSQQMFINASSDLDADVIGGISGGISIISTSDLESNIKAIANIFSEILSDSNMNTSVSSGFTDIGVNISAQSGILTEKSIAEEVWNSLASQFQNSLTMGGKLNSAGNAGDPWSTLLPGSYSGDQAGKIVADLEKLIQQVKSLTISNL